MRMNRRGKGKQVKALVIHMLGVTCVLPMCLIIGCKKEVSTREPSGDGSSQRVATSSNAEASRCPVEYIGGAILKLGYLKPGESHTRELRIVNRSNEPVGVRGVRTSCNCVKATYGGSRVLAPGEEGGLSIIVEPTPQENTWQKRYVMLELDSGTIAAACIWYRSAGTGYVTPEVVSLHWREGGRPPCGSVFIHSWGGQGCAILGWNSDNGYVDLAVGERKQDQIECTISVKASSPMSGNDRVHILTNKECGSQFEVNIEWEKQAGGIVLPPVIYLTQEQCGEIKTFTMRGLSGKPLSATDVVEIVCDKAFTVVPSTGSSSEGSWDILMSHIPSSNVGAGVYPVRMKTRRYGILTVHVYVSQGDSHPPDDRRP